jgi:hypothetical protein
MLQRMMMMLLLHGIDFTRILHSKSYPLVTALYQFSLFFPDSYSQLVISKEGNLIQSQEQLTEDT